MKKALKTLGLICLSILLLGTVGAIGRSIGQRGQDPGPSASDSSELNPPPPASPTPTPEIVESAPAAPAPPPVIAPPPPPPPAPAPAPKPKAPAIAPRPAPPPPAVVAPPPPPPPPPPAPAAASEPPPPPPPPPPAPVTPRVLWEGTGSGNQTTEKFTTQGSDWDMEWSYDCTAKGDQWNFIIWVNGSGYNQGVNELGMQGSGVQHYHNGGTFFLEISASCTWHVKVTG